MKHNGAIPMKFTGIVVAASGRGYWFIEQDQTRDCLFVHQRDVVGKKYLRVNDRVRFNRIPNTNPKYSTGFMAVDVEIIGLTIARQKSAPVSGESR
jgi:hypothetical protein